MGRQFGIVTAVPDVSERQVGFTGSIVYGEDATPPVPNLDWLLEVGGGPDRDQSGSDRVGVHPRLLGRADANGVGLGEHDRVVGLHGGTRGELGHGRGLAGAARNGSDYVRSAAGNPGHQSGGELKVKGISLNLIQQAASLKCRRFE